MTRLNWVDTPAGYSDGVSNAVLYSDAVGKAWNGLISVTEGASGTQEADSYFDGRRLVIVQNIGDFEATIQAYTYPDELDDYRGKRFGLSYRTQHSLGDRIHIVYNALVKPPNRKFDTATKTLSPSLFDWSLQASAVNIPGARPSSHIFIDTAYALPELVAVVEGWLYGTTDDDARLPDPEEFVDIFEAATTLRITQNGDGTYTASGPDHIVQVHEDGSFQIVAPTLLFLDEGIFEVDSF